MTEPALEEEGPMWDSTGEKEVNMKKDADSDTDEYYKGDTADSIEFPMRTTTLRLPGGSEVNLNSFTSAFGFFFLWGVSIWCMANPGEAREKLLDWRAGVTEKFTWFYIVSNPAFTFFILWLAYRYGDVKLGKSDQKPEFSDLTYFSMLFSAGVAVGLYFYGVSEPLWHQNSHWFANAGYRSQDEIDQWAMTLTMYHWGFAGWSPYIVMAVAAGIASFRFGLPLTVRSGLYLIFGPYTWGWIGDVIDGFSIVVTVAGICTSLGLGAMQIITGAQRLGWVDAPLDEDEMTKKTVTVIWIITAVATASVVSGLNMGIKLLSEVGFSIGLLLLFLCLAMEETNFLFNLHVQTVGSYFQWCIFQIPFWTDAFGQLESGEGRAVDGKAAETWWMDAWTVFYMAWWTAWAPYVGLFLARISKGRTIREVVGYSFIAPLMFGFLWFSTFGGIGLRQARQALELEKMGETYFENPAEYRVDGNDFCYNVPQEDVVVNNTVVFTNSLPGITPVCQFDSSDATQAWFNVMYSFTYPKDGFGGFGPFMAGLSMIALTIYFVTSSDSGSLIVDHLSANGQEDHHWVQRTFWALTEGAVATALLLAGGSEALQALQAASIVFALPFNVLLFLMMYCAVKMCKIYEWQYNSDMGEGTLPPPEANSFAMPIFGGVFNIFEFVVSLGSVNKDRVNRKMNLPSTFQVVEFLKGLFFPFWSMYRVYSLLGTDVYSSMKKVVFTIIYALLFLAWIAFFCAQAVNMGFVAFAWGFFFTGAGIMTNLRMAVRHHFSIEGNLIGDFFACSFFYPQTLCQMLLQFELSTQHEFELSTKHDKTAE